MLIGLISDTHIPREIKALPAQVKPALAGVDLILHAGDIYHLPVLDELEEIAPVLAARGNGDRVTPADRRLKESHLLHMDGFSLGLAHAIEYPEPHWYPLERAMEHYFGGGVDILVFGDSHVPLVEWCRGRLLINPGSPSLPWGLRQLGTIALLRIEGGEADARVVELGTGKVLARLTGKPGRG